MTSPHLNKTQVSIFRSLHHAQSLRYSDLLRPTGLESDSFKFHLRNLVKLELVTKLDDGQYALSAKGKELANNLDEEQGGPQKHPKLTLRICLSRKGANDSTEYLFQERHRNPFWGYWDTIGGPVLWGESIEDTAAEELFKQTELRAVFSVRAFYRVRDFDKQSKLLLEDKLFAVLSADSHEGVLKEDWHGGRNAWISMEELLQTGKYFASTPKMIDQLTSGPFYVAEDVIYSPDTY